MSNVKIYVACHLRDDNILKLPYSYYIPIHCGKAIYEKMANKNGWSREGYLPELGDDTGNNISHKNPNYCELTGMYWAWKNDDSAPNDIIGLNHYHRYFAEENSNDLELLTKETINEWLNEYDFLTNGADTESEYECKIEESVYQGYKDCHIINDLDIALEGVSKLYPELFESINKSIKYSSAMGVCNMIITRKYLFDEYSKFLFSVLRYVECNIDLKDDDHNDTYNERVFGFLGERLLRPWLMAKKYKAKSCPCLDWEKYIELI